MNIRSLLCCLLLHQRSVDGADNKASITNKGWDPPQADVNNKPSHRVLKKDSGKSGKQDAAMIVASKSSKLGVQESCKSINRKKDCDNAKDCIWMDLKCVGNPPTCQEFMNQNSCVQNAFIGKCIWKNDECIIDGDDELTDASPMSSPSPWPTYFPVASVSESPTDEGVGFETDIISGIRAPNCPPLLHALRTSLPSSRPTQKPTSDQSSPLTSTPTPDPTKAAITKPIVIHSARPTPKLTKNPSPKPISPRPTNLPLPRPTTKQINPKQPKASETTANPTMPPTAPPTAGANTLLMISPTPPQPKALIETKTSSAQALTYRRGDLSKDIRRFGFRVSKGITVRYVIMVFFVCLSRLSLFLSFSNLTIHFISCSVLE